MSAELCFFFEAPRLTRGWKSTASCVTSVVRLCMPGHGQKTRRVNSGLYTTYIIGSKTATSLNPSSSSPSFSLSLLPPLLHCPLRPACLLLSRLYIDQCFNARRRIRPSIRLAYWSNGQNHGDSHLYSYEKFFCVATQTNVSSSLLIFFL